MDIINQLLNGFTEFKDGGLQVQHPPTALSIRAANVIKELAVQHENNMLLINQLQLSQQELLQTLEDFKKLK